MNESYTVVRGITDNESRDLIIEEIENIVNRHKEIVESQTTRGKKLSISLSFLFSFEGISILVCLISNIIIEITIQIIANIHGESSLVKKRVFHLASFLLIILPTLFVNILLFRKLRHTEHIRPFVQVKESLNILKNELFDYNIPEVSTWDTSSSSFVTVYRNSVWKRIPSIMIAKNDIFKLRSGDRFPADAYQIELVRIPTIRDDTSSAESDLISNRLIDFKADKDNSKVLTEDLQSSINPFFIMGFILLLLVVPVLYLNSPYYVYDSVFNANVTNEAIKRNYLNHSNTAMKSTSRLESPTNNCFDFSDKLLDCSCLIFGTFVANSFGCTDIVSKYLSKSLLNKFTSKRHNTAFFEITRLVKNFIVILFGFLLSISIFFNIFWSLILQNKLDQVNYNKIVYFVNIVDNFKLNIYLIISFMPLIYKLFIEVTDVWGNARLQSLFQWLQVNRLSNHYMNKSEKHQKNKLYESPDSNSKSTLSFNESPDTRMSTSRLPFKNQIIELSTVLAQGLDSASNLLHTLNSTTSLVVVDKDGVLVDTQCCLQEICIPKKKYCENNNKRNKNNINCIGDDYLTATPLLPDCVVFDVLLDKTSSDGQRFENIFATKNYKNVLRPFSTVLSFTNLPLDLLQYNDYSNSNWHFAQNLLDIIQGDRILANPFKECFCTLKTLTNLQDSITKRLVTLRFFFVVQSHLGSKVYSINNVKKNHFSEYNKIDNILSQLYTHGKVILAVWLVKDISTGSTQLITKGHPKAILSRCPYLFDGGNVTKITPSAKRSFIKLMSQWKGDGFESLAVACRALTPDDYKKCLNFLDEHSVFITEPEYTISRVKNTDVVTTNMNDNVFPIYDKMLFSNSTTNIYYKVPYNTRYKKLIEIGRKSNLDQNSKILFVKTVKTQLDKKKWYNVNIFPGSRSSIGVKPKVRTLCRLSNHIQCLYTLENFKLDNMDYKSFQEFNVTSILTNYNNCNMTLYDNLYHYLMDDHLNIKPQKDINSADGDDDNHNNEYETNDNILKKQLTLHKNVTIELSQLFINNLIRRLVNNQIFLGMIAVRISTPQELVSKAGIRFIYMSRENDRKTKVVGQLLGLDTDWNCLISLKPLPKRVVNVEGNVVVPSGIPNIKMHIKNIDNVPLQVSLFSNGDQESIRNMIQILQENGEIVTCVGSSQRNSNFDLFDQANCSISVTVDRSPICKMCCGRRCIGNINKHIFPKLSSDIKAASSIISLPCALQIYMENEPPLINSSAQDFLAVPPSDPRWLLELLYEAFKESRRIVISIEQSAIYCTGVSIGFVASIILISSIFATPFFLNSTKLLVTLIIVFPVISVSLLFNPAFESIMKEFPLRLNDYKKTKKNIINTCFFYSIRFVPSSFVHFSLVAYYFHSIFYKNVQNLLNTTDITTSDTITKLLLTSCENKGITSFFTCDWIVCYHHLHSLPMLSSTLINAPMLHTQIISHTILIIFASVMSLSFIDKIQSLFIVSPQNNVWLIILWIIIFIFHIIITSIELVISKTWKYFTIPNLYYIALMLTWCLIIVTIDELVKYRSRKHNTAQQKYHKLLFNTRLGMWSPK